MASLEAQVRAFKLKAMRQAHEVVRETFVQFGGSLVTEWTPYGQPEMWKSPPPADYRPGNLQSSWFASVGAPSMETTLRTDGRAVNGIDRIPDEPAGERLFLSNSADHAGAIEGGHSWQAPVGILVNAQEFSPMVAAIARRIAG